MSSRLVSRLRPAARWWQVARRRGRPSTARGLVLVLVATLLTALPVRAEAAKPDQLSVAQPSPVQPKPVAAKPRPADLSQGAGKRSVPPVVWPTPGTAEASLASADPETIRRNGGEPPPQQTRAGGLPVFVAPAGAAAAMRLAKVSRARVEMLDRAALPEDWRDGLVMRVARADAVDTPGRITVEVDYRGFAGAFGADWSTRLRLVTLPECALTTPGAASCRAVELPSRNDSGAGRVSAEVDLPGAGAAAARASGTETLVAVQAAPSGPTGDYGATPLQASSTWVGGSSSGQFSWSYPLRMPPALDGPEPTVTFGYSSTSVDGRSDASNNQPSWLGEGFDYSTGFVERRYKPCIDDMGESSTNKEKSGDLCWGTDNAVLSFGERSGELIRDGKTGAWRLRGDEASKVERLTGAGNGDGDGEYWKITTADGVQYFFGRHALPGQMATTDSVNYVRVYGNNPGEPCYDASFTSGHCNQAWRWNLDYVVDTHGNTMSLWYERETNKYAAYNKDSDVVQYVRGSYPSRIDYGTWDRGAADRSVTPTAQVVFTPADRCLSNCATHNEANWPDVPWDQECTGSTCAGKYVPTFWSTKRLATVATRVAGVAGNAETWTLTHTFPPNGDASRDGMWLESIAHSGGDTRVPEVNFDFVHRANRVDALGDEKPPMYWMRMGTVWTEAGGKISVVYSDPECVKGSKMPASPETNTLLCYPVLSEDPFTKKIETEYFHKYVVKQVIESDWTGGGTDVITSYEYLDGVAWRHTDDDGLTRDKFRTWADFSGYGRVRTRQGKTVDGQDTLTETLYYRGLHGDKEAPSGGTRVARMPAVDLNGDGDTADVADAPAVNDENAFAGQVRRQTVYNGVDTDVVSVTVNQAWQSEPTASRDMGDTIAHARYTGIGATWAAAKLDAGRGWRVTKQSTTFDSYGLVDATNDLGDVAVDGDEQCVDTSYVRDTGRNVLTLPSRVQTLALACGTAPTTSEQVMRDVRTSYDGQAWGVSPTKGDATKEETLKDWNASGGTWIATSSSTFDGFGRVTASYDVRNNKTTTAYTPASGGPVKTVTTTNHLDWVSSEDREPAFGLPVRKTDVNGKVTTLEYDGLGRLTKVWQPNRPRAQNLDSPSTQYEYLIRNEGGVNAVATKTLNPEGAYLISYALYDGLLRARQTQTPAISGGGTVFTETVYDAAGRASYTAGTHHAPAITASTNLVSLAAWQFNSVTENRYDRAGRTIAAVLKSSGTEKWRTTTAYGGDRTYVTPPDGGTPITAITDAQGNTVELRQHSGGSTDGPYDATKYTYDRKKQLRKVVDTPGNQWTYDFDILGRRIHADDPDRGVTTSTYNDYGDLVETVDASNRKLVNTYDSLGRRTGVYDTSVATANKRSTWTYDPAGAKGQLASSSRWTGAGANEYKTRIVGYTPLYQPTGEEYTIPAAETGLAGIYYFDRSYKADGTSLATTTYPNAGGLGGEELTFTYDSVTGLPEKVTTNWPGAGQYVTNTDYTAFGELGFVEYQQTAQNWLQQSFVYDDTTRRLTKASAVRQVAPQPVTAVTYRYDPAGNILNIANTPEGQTADIQCFEYDHLRRLTQAWTLNTNDCGPDPTTAGLGGPAPYWQSWTYDTIGNRKTETRHATTAGATDSVATYTYPATGADRPHATTKVVTTGPGTGTRNYTYDARGNTTCQPASTAVSNTCPPGSGSQNLTWDSEGRLASLAEGGVTHTYLYDANGNRLIARDGTGRTLYLPGTELRYNSSTTSATRHYTLRPQGTAMRTQGSGITWLIGDHQGTQQIAVKAGDQAVTQRRQDPYGNSRGTNPTWPNPKGFVGGTNDPTGMVHIGAREYDAETGRFVSADPIIDVTDPQQIQGYGYANNTPITMSDPDGLRPMFTDTAWGDAKLYRETGQKFVKRNNGKWYVPKPKRHTPCRNIWEDCGQKKKPKDSKPYCTHPFAGDPTCTPRNAKYVYPEQPKPLWSPLDLIPDWAGSFSTCIGVGGQLYAAGSIEGCLEVDKHGFGLGAGTKKGAGWGGGLDLSGGYTYSSQTIGEKGGCNQYSAVSAGGVAVVGGTLESDDKGNWQIGASGGVGAKAGPEGPAVHTGEACYDAFYLWKRD